MQKPIVTEPAPAVAFTRYSVNGRLTKRLDLVDGKAVKQSDVHPTHGEWSIVRVPLAAGLEGVERELRSLTAQDAIKTGIPTLPGIDSGRFFSAARWNQRDREEPGDIMLGGTSGPGQLCPPELGLLCLDFDFSERWSFDSLQAVADYLRDKAGLSGVRMLVRPSSGSLIANSDGVLLRGLKGAHVFMIVHGSEHDDIRERLKLLLSAAGEVHAVVSAAGAVLDRWAVDFAACSVRRILYEAAPECGPGLVAVGRGDPLIVDGECVLLRLSALPSADSLKRDADRHIAAARAAVKAEADQVRAARIDADVSAEVDRKRAAGVDEREIHEPAVRAQVRGRYERGVLDEYAPIVAFESGSGAEVVLTLSQIRLDPARYHRWECLDLTEPEYRSRKRCAILFTDGPDLVLYSQAHGGRSWRAARVQKARVYSDAAKADFVGDVVSDLVGSGAWFRSGGLVWNVSGAELSAVDRELMELRVGGMYSLRRFDARARKRVACAFPADAAKLVHRSCLDRLPSFLAAQRHPIIWPDGEVQADGVRDGRLVYGCAGAPVARHLDADGVRAAFDCAMRPLSAYQFADDRARTLAFLAMLSVVNRAAWPTAPGWIIEAPKRGSGKTKLALVLGAIAGSHAMLHISGRPDEAEKGIATALRGSASVLILDNLKSGRELEAELLSQALTSESLDIRPFGSNNHLVAASCVRSWVCTVNNSDDASGTDVARRWRTIRINPIGLSPERTAFAFDPVAMATSQASEIRSALLGLLAAASPGSGVLGSYEAWACQTSGVLGLVRSAGVTGLVGFDDAIDDPAAVDAPGAALSAFLFAIDALPHSGRPAGKAFAARDVVSAASDGFGRPAAGQATGAQVWAALSELVVVNRFGSVVESGGRVDATRVGRELARLRDRQFECGGQILVLRSRTDRNGVRQFQCEVAA
ncbi:MAG: hypothetical protein QM766_24095 [Burkholderiaceae bacterium]